VSLAIVLLSLLSSEPLKGSACLATKASPRVTLVTVPEGTTLTYGAKTLTVRPGDAPPIGCLEDGRLVVFGYGLAVAFGVKGELPASPAAWRALREHLKDDPQQVGCLKKLAAGTPLYDRPDGEVVGLVVTPAHYGKWDDSKTASGYWSMLKAGVGLGPMELWLKDTSSNDWCPP
jgi:hypothetical protein